MYATTSTSDSVLCFNVHDNIKYHDYLDNLIIKVLTINGDLLQEKGMFIMNSENLALIDSSIYAKYNGACMRKFQRKTIASGVMTINFSIG